VESQHLFIFPYAALDCILQRKEDNSMKENELREAQIEMLGKQRARHHKIFRENMGRGTNPDGSDAYWKAKKKFDDADRAMKKIEKEIARLTTGGTPLPPPELEDRFPGLKEKAKKHKVGKKGTVTVKGSSGPNAPAGTQTKPSQSKVKLGG
jgi:hypothetical protein